MGVCERRLHSGTALSTEQLGNFITTTLQCVGIGLFSEHRKHIERDFGSLSEEKLFIWADVVKKSLIEKTQSLKLAANVN